MKKLLTLLTIVLLVTSCGKRSGLTFVEQTSQDISSDDKTILFDELKSRIIVPHCLTCHKRSGTEEGIERWVTKGDPENSKLYITVKEGRMPKNAPPLSTEDLEFIRQYILDTAKRAVIKTISFETLKTEILVPHCLGCHKRQDNEESLMRWINLESPLDSRLLQTVIEGKMPKNEAPLGREEQELIKQYLNNFIKKDN